ncbi:trigger factor [Natronogracilivirga saccharolytica]|uniref:Trigger factor n=1 Tax=Natronogracilivirga saccharolytica TaxID=2812953 RepID=A0A8J7RKC4_9BACT|nr:trigger factor [Natronogracilivirga saccharolytica]
MNISVEDKSKVDKVITITATEEDLKPRFEKAFREYRKKINMPGFRPGQVPVSIVKKRFGKEIESEEINNYVQEVFRDEIVPKYEPVGEPRFEDMSWENGQLEVKIGIGVKPDFEMTDLSSLEIDKMVHDVTDEEVDEELNSSLERAATWKESDQPVEETSKVTVDAVPLDEKGEPKADEQDTDKELDLNDDENADFRKGLKGAKAGDEVKVTLGEGDDAETFQLTVKKVYEKVIPELNEEFVKGATQGQLSSVDDYRSKLRSQIQDYYDQVSADMVKQEIMDKLIEAHSDMEVPTALVEKVQDSLLERMKQQQQGQPLPDGFDEQEYKESVREDAEREARWAFILDELGKKHEDLEITEEDIDARLASEAARYGLPTEMVKNFYAQSGDQLENLRQNIRTDKLFDRIIDEISLNELDKEAYQEKKKKERNEENDS